MSGCVELQLSHGRDFSLDVSFQIPDQGITVLFGSSGCGKTTVLRCTAGLERAHGRVIVSDQVWQDDAKQIFVPPWQRRLGYVFQEASLFEHLNVVENLRFGLKRSGGLKNKKRFTEAVELLGIGHLLQRRVQALSGGERQRVAIARALLMTPDLILMDEPLAALDWQRKQEILPWLERLRDELSVPMLYVTHSADEMARLADQLICFDNGRITAQGPLEEVLVERWPGAGIDGASVVLSGMIESRSSQWGMAMVGVDGVSFEVTDSGRAVGDAVRVRILAKDVSLALVAPQQTSMRNIVPATITDMRETGVSHVMLTLTVGTVRLLAHVTKHSVHELALKVGMPVFAQVKAVALIV